MIPICAVISAYPHQQAHHSLDSEMVDGHINIGWVLTCTALVMLMQGGFCLLESGLVRSKNSINVAAKNLVDFCLSSLLFWGIGSGIMFGASYAGLIGTNGFLPGRGSSAEIITFLMFQMVFCGTAATIISGAVAERMRLWGYLLVVVLLSIAIYPVIGHWAWGGVGTGNSAGWLEKRGFIDFAGATVVHSVGGWVSLAAVLVIGPRIGRFSSGRNPIRGHNIPIATMGVLVLWFGWLGFNGGSELSLTKNVPHILFNTILSGSVGGMVGLGWAQLIYRHPDVSTIINAVIAGLVGITAGCHVVSPAAALVIGTIAATLCFLATIALERLKIDDVIGAIPAHGVAGMWGTLSVALFGDLHLLGTGLDRWDQSIVQVTGMMSCFGWAFGVGFVSLWAINRVWPLRVTAEGEKAGLNITEHHASTEIFDLLVDMDKQRKTGDFTQHVVVETHTEIGQIASQYNRVLDTVNEEIAYREKNEREMCRMHNETTQLLTSISAILIGLNPKGIVRQWNEAAQSILGIPKEEAVGKDIQDLPIWWDQDMINEGIRQSLDEKTSRCFPEIALVDQDNHRKILKICFNPIMDESQILQGVLIVADDMTQHHQLLQQLNQAQRMESVGQLAAGIAHEINTPTQFIGDNTRFLQESFEDLKGILTHYESLVDKADQESVPQDLMTRLTEAIEQADLEYLMEEIPKAIEQSLDGIDRVSTIVKSMKEFSHPGGEKMQSVNLNQAIQSTITVSRNEWKYVAEMITDFDPELPHVHCLPGLINQVVLNMIVNASHAINDVKADTGSDGTITISTRHVDGQAEIRVTDTGCGIPESVRSKIFDPFFTTKEVGKGTGQGLAISHSVIVDKHEGSLSVDSQEGQGTTFVIRLPIEPAVPSGSGKEAMI